MDAHVDFFITARKTFLDAENVLYGWCDGHGDTFNVVALRGLKVACARKMCTGEVVGSQAIMVQECMLSTPIGVQVHAMCVQVGPKVVEVNVAAVGEVEHDTKSIPQGSVSCKLAWWNTYFSS